MIRQQAAPLTQDESTPTSNLVNKGTQSWRPRHHHHPIGLARILFQFVVILLVVTTSVSCSSTKKTGAVTPAKRRAASQLAPNEILPTDAAILGRIDRKRLREANRVLVLEMALQDVLRPMPALRRLIEHVDELWFALRDIPLSSAVDGAAVLRGDFRGFEVSRLIGGATDSATTNGGTWQDAGFSEPGVVVLQWQGPPPRFAPSLLVLLRSELLVLATPLYAEPILRTLRDGAKTATELPLDSLIAVRFLPPSERGQVGQKYPNIARVLRGTTVMGSLDIDPGATELLRVDLWANSESENASSRAESLMNALRETWAQSDDMTAQTVGGATQIERQTAKKVAMSIRARGVSLKQVVDKMAPTAAPPTNSTPSNSAP